MNIISVVVVVGRGSGGGGVVVVWAAGAAEISGRGVAVTVNDRRSGRVVCSRNVTTIVVVIRILVVRIYILLLVQGHGQLSCVGVYYHVILVGGGGDGRVKSPRCKRISTGADIIRCILQYRMLLLLLLKMVFRIHI